MNPQFLEWEEAWEEGRDRKNNRNEELNLA